MNALVLILVGVLITPALAAAAWIVDALNARGKKLVLFVDHYNAGRSQLAQAYMREKYGRYFHAISAGVTPEQGIYPLVYELMTRVGLAHRLTRPRRLNEALIAKAIPVLLCPEEEIQPIDPTAIALLNRNEHTIRWRDIDGLIGKTSIEEVKDIFADIRRRIDSLVLSLLAPNGNSVGVASGNDARA